MSEIEMSELAEATRCVADALQITERCNAGRCPTLAAVHEQLAVANRECARLQAELNKINAIKTRPVTAKMAASDRAALDVCKSLRFGECPHGLPFEVMSRDVIQPWGTQVPFRPLCDACVMAAIRNINSALCSPPKCPGCGADAVQVSEPVCLYQLRSWTAPK